MHKINRSTIFAVVDPGFPVGGAPDPMKGANLRNDDFLAETYVKMKELGPIWRGAVPVVPPGSATDLFIVWIGHTSTLFSASLG